MYFTYILGRFEDEPAEIMLLRGRGSNPNSPVYKKRSYGLFYSLLSLLNPLFFLSGYSEYSRGHKIRVSVYHLTKVFKLSSANFSNCG